MTLTARLYCDGRLEREDLDPDRIDEALAQPDALLWVDVEDPATDDIALLGREFGFHELALEDCVHPHQRPKIEQYGNYYFLVAYGATVDGEDLRLHEMAMFVGHKYLVTVRKEPAYDVTRVSQRWNAHAEQAVEGGGYLVYVLLDEVVDGYFSALDAFTDRTEQVEDAIFEGRVDPELQTHVFKLRKELLEFRRAVAPLRDVLDVMQRRTIDVVTPALEPYYRDVYDHVLRSLDFLDSARDVLSSALEASLAVVSNRLNEVMKKLTSWAAIILIPTLIAGIYGMNFEFMPELRWRYGYAWALGVMAASAFVLYRVFRRRDWL